MDDNSVHHHVGLFHGPQTGNLMIYCDNDILVVDFLVFDSKVYTFFIEDELLEVRLERKGDEMYYSFVINKKADTLRNRLRKKIEQKNLKHLWIFIVVLVLFVGGVTTWWMSQRKEIPYVPPAILLSEGVRTTGLVFTTGEGRNQQVAYRFVAGSQAITSRPVPAINLLSETQLPVSDGDEFEVWYLPQRPSSHALFWDRPTARQVQRFLDRVVAQSISLHPSAMDSARLHCEAKAIWEWRGISGLADLYYQEALPYENTYHHRDTYRQLLLDPEYTKSVTARCQ